mgnify:CR=1 FL=1
MADKLKNFEEKMAEMQALKTRLDGPKTRSKVEEGELVKAMFSSMVEFFPICYETLRNLKTHEGNFLKLTEDLNEVKGDLDEVKEDVEGIKTEMNAMKAELTKVITTIQADNAYLKKQAFESEVEKSQNAVIIRNFEPTNQAGKIGEDQETGADLRLGLDRFLTFLQINERIKLKDAFRLKSRDKKGKSLFSPVKLCFHSKNDRAIFFSNVRLLRESQYNRVNICQDVPRCLSAQFQEVDTQGYNLRIANPGMKTKVVLYKMNYTLMVKQDGERTFNPYRG